MAGFKAAMVGTEGKVVPDWVHETMERENVDFVAGECTTREELAELAGDADVVWVNGGSEVVKADTLSAIPKCVALIRTGSGTDNIPVEEATKLGIIVAHTPEAHHQEVSDHAIGLLFAVVRQIAVQDRAVRDGKWDAEDGMPRWHLVGQTLGLVGFGLIARQVAKKMSGFDMTVLAYDPYVNADTMTEVGVQSATLDEVLSRSDFVSIHSPLTKETRHSIGERELRLMKPEAVLVNTSRGPVIDEPALVKALESGWIAAAGLDVTDEEPPRPDNPLFRMNNVVVTPHIAGYSDQHEYACWRLSVDTVIDLSKGSWPRRYVNRGVKPRIPLR